MGCLKLTYHQTSELKIVYSKKELTSKKSSLKGGSALLFGMVMPNGDNLNIGDHTYGFNGKENVDEISGSGNILDYGFRIYNPRLGKFLSVDPLTAGYPWYSPYHFAGNNPIRFIDMDGLEEAEPRMTDGGQFGYDNTLILTNDQAIKDLNNNIVSQFGMFIVTMIGDALLLITETPTNFHMATNDYADRHPEHALQYTQKFNKNVNEIAVGLVLGAASKKVFAALGPVAKKLIHKTAFKNGASHITTKKKLMRYGDSPTYGGDDLFVAPSKEIDDLLNSGASRSDIEKALGLDKGILDDGSDLIRIDIATEAMENLRLPTGAEAGANEFFIQGGKTIGGITEGIIKGVPKGAKGVTKTVVKPKVKSFGTPKFY